MRRRAAARRRSVAAAGSARARRPVPGPRPVRNPRAGISARPGAPASSTRSGRGPVQPAGPRYPVQRTPGTGNTIMTELPYRTVIGLEVHVQLLTRTKLFCGCSTAFGLPPNSATCPVCLGLPGVLPFMNRHVFDLAHKADLTLHLEIGHFTNWDRRN